MDDNRLYWTRYESYVSGYRPWVTFRSPATGWREEGYGTYVSREDACAAIALALKMPDATVVRIEDVISQKEIRVYQDEAAIEGS